MRAGFDWGGFFDACASWRSPREAELGFPGFGRGEKAMRRRTQLFCLMAALAAWLSLVGSPDALAQDTGGDATDITTNTGDTGGDGIGGPGIGGDAHGGSAAA